MPMDFPDLASLHRAAKVHSFRERLTNESEEDYREALANHVAPIDFIESEEIRNKVGWDKFSDRQTNLMLLKSFLKNK